ncbi:MAG: GNAT family N-acetyltransferase [Methanomicrobiales archaeon]|nr:GNAT family N-acetyltransferase [Methanomicrobiales archaeon]MDI6877018.1 GNAT family N-acetyltransferase [Methanomicrobiales archaeon]
MEIVLAGGRGEWDDFVERNPGSEIFHRWDFLKIVEEQSGCRLLPYAIYRGREMIGVLPLFHRALPGLGYILSPPPRTAIPYLGLLLDSSLADLKQHKRESVLRSLGEKVIAEIASYSPSSVIISNPPCVIDVRPFQWGGYGVEIAYTYEIDLGRPLSEIWSGFSKDRRQKIGRASRSGIEIVRGTDLSRLCTMLERRYREQGLTNGILSQRYLERLAAAFPRNFSLYYARHGDAISGAVLMIKYNDAKVWVGTPRSENHSNELLIWELLREAKAEGYPRFELVGANTRQLCTFKSQFNPHLRPYLRVARRNLRGRMAESLYHRLRRRGVHPGRPDGLR